MTAPRRRVLLGAALGAVSVAILLAGGNGLIKVWRVRQQVEALQREIQLLEAENDRLARAIQRLQDDPAMIEKIAREGLGYVRKDEKVLKFPSTPRPAPDNR